MEITKEQAIRYIKDCMQKLDKDFEEQRICSWTFIKYKTDLIEQLEQLEGDK